MYACLYAQQHADAVTAGGIDLTAALLGVAREFSPRVEPAGPGAVVCDLAGLARLFGDARTIAGELRREAADRGIPVRVAVAGTRTAALIAAHAHPGLTIVEPGGEAAALAPLPVRLLDVFLDLEVGRLEAGTPAPQARFYRTSPMQDDRTPPRRGATASTRVARRRLARGARSARAPRRHARPLGHHLARGARRAAAGRGRRPLRHRWPAAAAAGSRRRRRAARPGAARRTVRSAPGSRVARRGARAALVRARPAARADCRASRAARSRCRRARRRTAARVEGHVHAPAAVARTASAIHGRCERWRCSTSTRIRRAPGSMPSRCASSRHRAACCSTRSSSVRSRRPSSSRRSSRGSARSWDPDRVGSPLVPDTYRPGAFVLQPFVVDRSARGVSSPSPSLRLRDAGRAVERRSGSAPRTAGRAAFPSSGSRSASRSRDAAAVRIVADRSGATSGQVDASAGPWHTSGAWWNDGWDRDEWDVALDDGTICRVYQDRATRAWFLDGVIDLTGVNPNANPTPNAAQPHADAS